MRRHTWLVLLVIAAMFPLPQARAAAQPDWLLITIKAGSRPTEIGFPKITITASPNGQGPLVYGYGVAVNRAGDVIVDAVRNDAIYIDSTEEAGDFHERVETPNLLGDFVPYSAYWPSRIEKRQTLAMLFFLANARVTRFEIVPPPTSPAATVRVRSGRGSRAVVLTDRRNDGPAVAVGSLSVADVTRNQVLRTGVAGGVGWAWCVYCQGSWRGPGGRAGDWQADGYPGASSATGAVGFAGPPGRWSWQQTGVTNPHLLEPLYGVRSPLLAAWAPVGAGWRYFSR